MKIGKVIVLSAPTCAGKTRIEKQLLKDLPLVYSVSCTTRAPRIGETNGVEYHFLTRTKFLAMQMNGHFLESTPVYGPTGHLYGTPKRPVIDQLRKGNNVLIDCDVVGAVQIMNCKIPLILLNLHSFFIQPDSLEDLLDRLVDRGTPPDEIMARLKTAKIEMRQKRHYDHVITNKAGEFESSYLRFRNKVEKCLC